MINFLYVLSVSAQRQYQIGDVPPVTPQEAAAGVFQVIANSIMVSFHAIIIPNSGKIIQLERIDGGELATTHSAEFDYYTALSRVLTVKSDIFCSSGLISPEPSARLVNVGGWSGASAEAIRILPNCGNPGFFGRCNWFEDAQVATLKAQRWYPSVLPLANGRAAVIGGTDGPTGVMFLI